MEDIIALHYILKVPKNLDLFFFRFFECVWKRGRAAKESMQRKLRRFIPWNPSLCPRWEARKGWGRGQRELSTYRSAGVQHSQETRGTTQDGHKAKRRGKGKAERGRGSTHDTANTPQKREAVNTPAPHRTRWEMTRFAWAGDHQSSLRITINWLL